jgi:hypothetical protein
VDVSSLPRPSAAATVGDVAADVVEAAVWAPSVNNTQPWFFTARGQQLSLYADAGRQLTVADPARREMLISCGAALFTARLALRALGWVPRQQMLPDPAEPLLVARVSWQQRAAPAMYEMRLFDQVLRSRTHRGGFEPLPIAPEFLSVLRAGAERDKATLRIITDPASVAALAATVQTAEQAVRLDGARVREAAAWASPPGSPRPDGVPAGSYPARQVHIVPDFPGRDFAHGCGWGLPPCSAQATARWPGVVCLLTTPHDRPLDWLSAGQALQRLLLTSTASGVAAALHTQPLELDWLRQSIRAQLGDESFPQLLLRLGTVVQTGTSVRRSAASVLVQQAQRSSRDHGI